MTVIHHSILLKDSISSLFFGCCNNRSTKDKTVLEKNVKCDLARVKQFKPHGCRVVKVSIMESGAKIFDSTLSDRIAYGVHSAAVIIADKENALGR